MPPPMYIDPLAPSSILLKRNNPTALTKTTTPPPENRLDRSNVAGVTVTGFFSLIALVTAIWMLTIYLHSRFGQRNMGVRKGDDTRAEDITFNTAQAVKIQVMKPGSVSIRDSTNGESSEGTKLERTGFEEINLKSDTQQRLDESAARLAAARQKHIWTHSSPGIGSHPGWAPL
ncbi:hypothetical protein BGZ60DRAFT_532725 [Tricladium varicosporioides]|nr:hypothetical protein BGZ60DRAFT_532725 [Hymenoscyphus varicosporioides]